MPNIGTTDKDVSSDIIYVLRKNFEPANWKEISTMGLIPAEAYPSSANQPAPTTAAMKVI